jgi:hypothetical protein
MHAHTSFVCGACILLGEVLRAQPQLRALITDANTFQTAAAAAAASESAAAAVADKSKSKQQPTGKGMEDSEDDEDDDDDDDDEDESSSSAKPKRSDATAAYDSAKRDPLHAGAARSCLWELNQVRPDFLCDQIFLRHFILRRDFCATRFSGNFCASWMTWVESQPAT